MRNRNLKTLVPQAITEVSVWDWTKWIEAMEKESKLKDAIEELRGERRQYQQRIEELDKLIDALDARTSNRNGAVTSTVVMHRTEFLSAGIAEAAEKMIRRANKPLHVKDITEGLKAGGYPFRSKNPYTSVAPVLWMTARKKGSPIVKLPKNIYSLREIEEKRR